MSAWRRTSRPWLQFEPGPDRLWPGPETISALFSSGGVGVCVAALLRRCCVGDRIREGFGETIIAPVVHMEPVRRKECLEWHTIDVVPVPHESKAVKHVDVLLRGNGLLVDACGMWHCHACHSATRNPESGKQTAPLTHREPLLMQRACSGASTLQCGPPRASVIPQKRVGAARDSTAGNAWELSFGD
jgi:hypothetical protein